MQELTDDQLDGLFRKSAEEFDPPFDPAAWQSMQGQLDVQNSAPSGKKLFRRKLLRWGIPPLALLLLVGISWYTYQAKSATSTKSLGQARAKPTASPENNFVKSSETAGRAKQTQPTSDFESDVVTSDTRSQTNELPKSVDRRPVDATALAKVSSPVTKSSQLDETGTNAPTPALKVASGENPDHTAVMARSKPNAVVKRKPVANVLLENNLIRSANPSGYLALDRLPLNRTSDQFKKRRTTRIYSPTDHTGNPTSTGSKQSVTNEPANSPVAKADDGMDVTASASLPPLTTLSIQPGHWPKYADRIDRAVTIPQPEIDEQPQVVKPAPQQLRGLSVRFAVSPDLSTIGLRNFSRPGTNVGMLLEYRLASRWSVQAGVIQSTKIYRGSISEYELPPYTKVRPESVNGRCNMLDIPINLRYDVARRPRLNGQVPSRWFVSGGVTTYVMRKEDYDYNYPAGTHLYPTTPLGWSGSTGKWFNFSQLNLSGGYERSISRKLSWQVEPFVKVPLKSVGYLKLNLLSTGAFLSLRYKL